LAFGQVDEKMETKTVHVSTCIIDTKENLKKENCGVLILILLKIRFWSWKQTDEKVVVIIILQYLVLILQ